MTSQNIKLDAFDRLLGDDSHAAALVFRQELIPAEGRDAVFFPPTYALEKNASGYNIDVFPDGTNVCLVDSVGSQANRMEPLFKSSPYSSLIPRLLIEADENGAKQTIDVLDAGHRVADALVRFSDLHAKIEQAFLELRNNGDALPLARLAPTSLVFGVWDSRGTQVKVQRVVRSVIRAYNVRELTRSAQYTTVAGEILEGGEATVETRGTKAELGLAHVPATRTHGGVQLTSDGKILRDAIVNLTALRKLSTPSEPAPDTIALRRYLLGLALVSVTAPMSPNLREGCELVPAPGSRAAWHLVDYDGDREQFDLSHDRALSFARVATDASGIERETIRGRFDSARARKAIKEKKGNSKKKK